MSRYFGSATGTPSVPLLIIDPPTCGWTVVQDPKFVYSATYDKTYIGWIGLNDGDAYIAEYDHATDTLSTPVALHGSGLGGGQGNPDPHDSPAILVRSDGKILVAYSPHEGSTCYLRISTSAGDATAFDVEQNLDAQLGGTSYTYMGLAQLSDEVNTIHLFFRNKVGTTGYIAWAKSTDGGATWGSITDIFDPNTGQRTYRRMGSNGVDRIDIVTTHKDPDPTPATAAALFHLYYDAADGLWHASDGTALTLPATKYTATLVQGADTGSAWGSGIAYVTGAPVVLTEIQHASTVDVHQRRWDGSVWNDHTLEDGLAAIYSNAYLPGAMSPDNADLVWISKKVGSYWEMFRYTSADAGVTWTATQMTSGSTVHNTQPDGVWGGSGFKVIWLRGLDNSGPDFNQGDWEIWGGV